MRLAPLVLVALAAQAQVKITSERPKVLSRDACMLTAVSTDGVDRMWRWTIQDPGHFPKILVETGPGQARFTAPATLVPRTFTVVVTAEDNPAIRTTLQLPVEPDTRPGTSERALVDALFPGSFTPSMHWFHGDNTPSAKDSTLRTPLLHAPRATSIAFCEDTSMGALNRCWLLAGINGLEAFSLTGRPVAIPDFLSESKDGFSIEIDKVATRYPWPGPVPEGASRVVFAGRLIEKRPGFPGYQEVVGTGIWALMPDGSAKTLWVQRRDPSAGYHPLAHVSALALDREGNVYFGVPSEYEIRRIDRSNQVTVFAGGAPIPIPTISHPVPVDGTGTGARFSACGSMTVDPASGDLYVMDYDCIRRITPAGVVTTVLGNAQGHPSAELLAPGILEAGKAFRFVADTLVMHGRELVLTDIVSRQLVAFHLDTRRLVRLLGPAPGVAGFRMGPIPFLNPTLPLAECAAIANPGALGISAKGMCILALGPSLGSPVDGLAELDLPDGPLTAAFDEPGKDGDSSSTTTSTSSSSSTGTRL